MTPDVNVVLAAVRPDHPHHRTALDWLESTLSDRDSLGITLLPMAAWGGNGRVFGACAWKAGLSGTT